MWLLLKNLLFTAVAPGTTAVVIPLWLAAREGAEPSTLHGWLSAPLFVFGVGLYVVTVFNFAHVGRGTPAPIDPPKTLIVRGPHRYVRNPMYWAVLSVVVAWSILFSSLAILGYAAVLGLFFHLFVVLVEEPSLRRQFGSDYLQYCNSVRRWWPGRPG